MLCTHSRHMRCSKVIISVVAPTIFDKMLDNTIAPPLCTTQPIPKSFTRIRRNQQQPAYTIHTSCAYSPSNGLCCVCFVFLANGGWAIVCSKPNAKEIYCWIQNLYGCVCVRQCVRFMRNSNRHCIPESLSCTTYSRSNKNCGNSFSSTSSLPARQPCLCTNSFLCLF